jgi:murein DD-endopeptidase MepM/ murein hydrolase activator NlpD
VKKYKEQIDAAPEAPFLPWKKKRYNIEREAWKTALDKSWSAYVEAVKGLGINAADPSSIAEEAMTIHKNYKAAAAMEARTNRPDAAEAIKWHEAEEAARKKRNEEIWEARVKIARGLVRDPDATVSSTFGQHTRGILYGLFEHEGQHIAVQRSTKGHVYLHRVPSENVAKLERLIGKEIYMSSRLGKFSVEVSERAAKNRSRGIGR